MWRNFCRKEGSHGLVLSYAVDYIYQRICNRDMGEGVGVVHGEPFSLL